MRQRIAITDDEGITLEVVALPPDFIAWERHAKRRMSDLADGLGMEDMAFLAWSALRRRSSEPRPPFDVWIQHLSDLEFLEDEPPTPTKPEASAMP